METVVIVRTLQIIHSIEIICLPYVFPHPTPPTVFVLFQQLIHQNIQLIYNNPAVTFHISVIFTFSDI